jgi:AraC-like DNA-binding protein
LNLWFGFVIPFAAALKYNIQTIASSVKPDELRKKGRRVKVSEKGVLPASNIYLHTPGEESLKLFLYPICCGRFFCDGNYLVSRANYDSFLLLYVKEGKGFARISGRESPIARDDIVLVDCYRPHRYGTTSGWEILWVHFDGAAARDYFEAISQGNDGVAMSPQNTQSVYQSMYKIYAQFHETCAVNDTLNNKYLVNALTEFLLHRNAAVSNRAAGITEDVLAYIAENLQTQLRLEELAERASLSPYYFARLFKKETGYTPHKYVLAARINAAKFYLKSTAMSVKEISLICGFSSECSFCTAFKRIIGTTPMTYRNRLS